MHFCPKVPVMLVGCKKDLRRDPQTIENLRKQNQRPVAPEQVSSSRSVYNALEFCFRFNPAFNCGTSGLLLLHFRHAKMILPYLL